MICTKSSSMRIFVRTFLSERVRVVVVLRVRVTRASGMARSVRISAQRCFFCFSSCLPLLSAPPPFPRPAPKKKKFHACNRHMNLETGWWHAGLFNSGPIKTCFVLNITYVELSLPQIRSFQDEYHFTLVLSFYPYPQSHPSSSPIP